MRNVNIFSSTSNAICRFSVRANEMLRLFIDLQHRWHLQPSILPASAGSSGTACLLRTLIGTGVPALASARRSYLAVGTRPTGITGLMVSKPAFQTLS